MKTTATRDDGCSYLITGASSFLGKALARVLSKNEGNHLLLTSRNPIAPRSTPSKSNITCLPGIDLTTTADLSKLAAAADKHFPGNFHVINCLGFFPGYRQVSDLAVDEARKVFESNITALYGVAHQILPLMQKRNGGHFIAFSSHTNYQHYPNMVAYSAAKAAVECLITGIANECLHQGIIANTIALATLDTATEWQMKPKGDRTKWLRPVEVSRFVENFVRDPGGLVNGNVIHLYKYSRSYFHQSFFDRITK